MNSQLVITNVLNAMENQRSALRYPGANADLGSGNPEVDLFQMVEGLAREGRERTLQ